MLFRLVRPMRRKASSNLYFVQRIPADLRKRIAGVTLSVPVGDTRTFVKLTTRSQAVRVSLRTRDPVEAKVRQAAAAAYLARTWQALREAPRALSQKQAVALAGELYRTFVGALPEGARGPHGGNRATARLRLTFQIFLRGQLGLVDYISKLHRSALSMQNGEAAWMIEPSKKAKGTSYEIFVQELYQTLLNADGFDTIKIEKNANITGRSGCPHEIDIFWEFRVAGQKYKTAIECKNYTSKVTIGRIRDFYGVLADVKNLQGVFVSVVGFQSGAKKYAEHYGISLKEVREPADSDWKGRVENIKLRLFIVTPVIRELRPDVTKDFLSSLAPDHKIDMGVAGSSDAAIIFDTDGNPIASIDQIWTELPHNNCQETDLEKTIPYPNRVWRAGSGTEVPIDSVTVRYDVLVEVEEANILGKAAAKAIMKDVKSGDITFFTKDGRVKQVRNRSS